MIGFLRGQVKDFNNQGELVLFCGEGSGVGYYVYVPSRSELKDKLILHTTLELWIYTHVRENALELFGFISQQEKQIFEMLLGVSGIGPRTALGLLSGLTPEELLQALTQEDRTKLSGIPGIGKKTIERIFLDLADKIKKLPQTTSKKEFNRFNEKDAFLALREFGYRDQEAKRIWLEVSSELSSEASLEVFIRKVLEKGRGGSVFGSTR